MNSKHSEIVDELQRLSYPALRIPTVFCLPTNSVLEIEAIGYRRDIGPSLVSFDPELFLQLGMDDKSLIDLNSFR